MMEITSLRVLSGRGRKLYIETYGCQMNVADSEVILALLEAEGWRRTDRVAEADAILLNTCAIRDNAEQRVRGRLRELRSHKKRAGVVIGVVGCMAERLRETLFDEEPAVDLLAGPDAYRDLPRLLAGAAAGGRETNVILSQEETYADVTPVRLDAEGVGAFVSIMRGCNNFCSYCVVPYTRGRERSRDPRTVVAEAERLFGQGCREVTLLGQNVNSYRWTGDGQTVDFATLVARVAEVDPSLRVRFATSHPKDISDRLLETIAAYPNVCRAIHLPAQSGSTRMLGVMNRRYTREWYLERVAAIRRIVPECAVSTDLIAGFCTETEEDHLQTLSLMREVRFDFAYMFKYSERPGTRAARTMPDDVPDAVKTRRLNEIIVLQNELSLVSNRADVGRTFEVLVEGVSKRREDQLFGRTSQNKVVVFDRGDRRPGDYLRVCITGCTSATLTGEAERETGTDGSAV